MLFLLSVELLLFSDIEVTPREGTSGGATVPTSGIELSAYAPVPPLSFLISMSLMCPCLTSSLVMGAMSGNAKLPISAQNDSALKRGFFLDALRCLSTEDIFLVIGLAFASNSTMGLVSHAPSDGIVEHSRELVVTTALSMDDTFSAVAFAFMLSTCD